MNCRGGGNRLVQARDTSHIAMVHQTRSSCQLNPHNPSHDEGDTKAISGRDLKLIGRDLVHLALAQRRLDFRDF